MAEFNREKVQEAVKQLLLAMGQDIERPGLKETPRRVAGYWQELLEGENYTNRQIAEKYNKSFDVGYSNLVVKEVKNVYSHCEHHLALMFNGTVYVAYIPIQNEDGSYKVLGLSKIDRIVDLCSKRLQLQEKLAADIAECISLATGSDMVYVQIVMNHGCVSARGPKSEGVTDVTYISDNLKLDTEARQEIELKISNLRK
jgi:GTP cyclohydrolase I